MRARLPRHSGDARLGQRNRHGLRNGRDRPFRQGRGPKWRRFGRRSRPRNWKSRAQPIWYNLVLKWFRLVCINFVFTVERRWRLELKRRWTVEWKWICRRRDSQSSAGFWDVRHTQRPRLWIPRSVGRIRQRREHLGTVRKFETLYQEDEWILRSAQKESLEVEEGETLTLLLSPVNELWPICCMKLIYLSFYFRF